MQNQKFLRLTELPSPPVSPKNNVADEVCSLPKPNFNEQRNPADISYIDATTSQWNVSENEAYLNHVLRPSTNHQKFTNSAYLNDAFHRDADQQNSLAEYAYVNANPCPKISERKISERNNLYLEVDTVTSPASQTGRRVGKY